MSERAYRTAQLARVFGLSMAEVRQMTGRDIAAMSQVITEERQERERQAQLAKRRQQRGRG